MDSSIGNDILAPGRLDAAYLESMFQGARVAIVACEPNGAIVASNQAAATLFGAEQCFPAQPILGLFPGRDRARAEVCFDSCVTQLEPVEMRTRLGGTESDPVDYAVWFTPVLETDGVLRGVALWFRDITQRMRLRRMLDKQDKLASLGSLSGAVAHHYNNLLCCIATSIEYAISMNTLPAMRRALERTADAVTRATRITQQLLSFAQADHRSTDLADLTETVLFYADEHEDSLARKNVRLTVDAPPIPVLAVRRDQLMVILNNLVENAVEAMPDGGSIHFGLARRDEGSVVLSISDTGGGVDPRHMEHLFEPFFTTKGALAEGAGKNAGMGLAVVHGLVGEMHGTISAANVPGRGARFDIVLPIQPV